MSNNNNRKSMQNKNTVCDYKRRQPTEMSRISSEFINEPRNPVFLKTDQGTKVYFADAKQIAKYKIILIRESAILTGEIQEISLDSSNMENGQQLLIPPALSWRRVLGYFTT